MARPQKDETERRTEKIQIRLTQEEAAAIKEAADEQRRTPSDYVRTVVMDAIEK
jgi:uncharacterized protein (DUF1778 family)